MSPGRSKWPRPSDALETGLRPLVTDYNCAALPITAPCHTKSLALPSCSRIVVLLENSDLSFHFAAESCLRYRLEIVKATVCIFVAN